MVKKKYRGILQDCRYEWFRGAFDAVSWVCDGIQVDYWWHPPPCSWICGHYRFLLLNSHLNLYSCHTLSATLTLANMSCKWHKPPWQVFWPLLKQEIAHLEVEKVLQTIQASLYNPTPPNRHCPWKQHISKRVFPYTDHPAFLRGRLNFWNSLKAQTNLSFHRSATCVLLKSTSWEPHRNLILTTTIDYYHYWLLIN